MVFNYGYLWGLINGLEKSRNILYKFLLYLQAASRCWIMYDEQYRLKKSRYPTSSLGIVDQELWLFCVARDNAIYPYNPASYTPQGIKFLKTSTFRVIGDTLLLMQPVFLRTNIHFKSVRGVLFKGRGTNGSNLMKFAVIWEKCRYEHRCSKCNGKHRILRCAKSKLIINDIHKEYYS